MLKTYRIVLVITLGVFWSGCASLNYRLTGVVAESSAAGTYAFIDLQKARVDGKDFVLTLSGSEVIETEHVIKVDVQYTASTSATYDYCAVLGALPGSGATVKAQLQTTPDPELLLDSLGFLFMWRGLPVGRTRWVSAASTGSTLILQRFSAAEERVFFLDGTSVKVECIMPGNTEPPITLTTGQYAVVTKDGSNCKFVVNTIPAVPGGTTDDIYKFVDAVKKIATAARWPY